MAAPPMTPLATSEVATVLSALLTVAQWLRDHVVLLAFTAALAGLACEWVARRLAAKASEERMVLEVTPARHFDPGLEEIFRRGAQLARASTSTAWWAPRRAKAVRIRLRADGSHPLRYLIEGPTGAERLLSLTPFGPGVSVRKTILPADAPRDHTVRAEFILRGRVTAPLREVPLEPDPLQPLVDAVSDLRAELGDLAEVCLDIQRAPKWALRARRAQLMHEARQAERRETQRSSRLMREHSEDSFTGQLAGLVSDRKSGGRGLLVSATPRRVDSAEALGKLADDDQLARVQLLVTCSSDTEGRAEARLAQIQAGLDVFGARSRWAIRGWSLGPWRLGADKWPNRRSFDRRWALGQCQPPKPNWVRLEEITGLLKPPTVHCRMPLLAGTLPTFEFGDPELLLQGIYRAPDGSSRLVATRAEETLFECAVGKAGGGKTERALAQAIGWAHAGGGLLFVDPHRDSWPRAATYLAHDDLAGRIALVDLNAVGANPAVPSWNPIGMHQGQQGFEVVESVTDAYAAMLGWEDAGAPRAITILTACLSMLVAVNTRACREGRPQQQTTLFQVRPLLTDAAFRGAALAAVGDALEAEVKAWWDNVFPTLTADAFHVVLNPIARLAANPVTKAFLGRPDGAYNIRAAMDAGMIVWVCPGGNGPTDRLVTALLSRDLLRAVRSRRHLAEDERRPFRVYFDELITLTGSAPETIASMFEDFRKFKVRVHGMTQLLGRLPSSVRLSLVQNASTLSSTAGSRGVVSAITNEWGDEPSPEVVAALDRFEHFISVTVDGKRVGPLRITGPHLDDTFARYARPRKAVRALEAAARARAEATPLNDSQAAEHVGDAARLFGQHSPAASLQLNKTKGYQ